MAKPTQTPLINLSFAIIIILIIAGLNTDQSFAQTSITKSSTIELTVPNNSGPPAGDTTSPTAPILLRPTDGTYTSHSRPEFVWLQSTDPNSNNILYDLYLNGVATFLGINNYGNSLTHNYTARIEDGSLRLLPLQNLVDGTYNWYVVAYDSSGNKQSSATWHLTIDTLAPKIELLQVGSHKNPDIIQNPTINIKEEGITNITISSDPYSTITLLIIRNDRTVFSSTQKSDLSGRITFNPTLNTGHYQLFASSSDLASNTSSLPSFFINIALPSLTSDPGIELPPPIEKIIQSLEPLTTLPATALLVASRVQSSDIIYTLIAVTIIILLITRRNNNIRVLHASSKKPISKLSITTENNKKYTTNSKGSCYIPHLSTKDYLLITQTDIEPKEQLSSQTLTLCITALTPPLTTLYLQ